MRPSPVDPKAFFAEFYGSKAARDGSVIRRKIRDVDRLVGRDAFLNEAARRGFPVFENAGQFIVMCNNEPVRRVR